MFVRASLVTLTASLLAREAAACEPDPCADAVAVLDVERAGDAEVPIDGALVLRVEIAGDVDPEELQDRVEVIVMSESDPVAGTLELAELPGLLLWRPAASLTPTTNYNVFITLSNPGAPAGCIDELTPIIRTFTAAATPAAALVPPTVDATAIYREAPQLTLEGVVCCNDAYPYEQSMCGVAYGITWDRGRCAARETRGSLRVELTADPGADPASASQWARVLRQDGEPVASGVATTFVRDIEAPTCFSIDQLDLATGERVEGDEQCFGDADAGRLGVRPLDPASALDGRCVSDVYTCAVEDGAWDRSRCESVDPPPQDEEPDETPTAPDGCGCRTAPPPLALLALLALPRRRRLNAGPAA